MLAALPPQDLARLYDGTLTLGRQASTFANEQFARWAAPSSPPAKPMASLPQTTATLQAAPPAQDKSPQDISAHDAPAAVPRLVELPKLVERPSLLSEEARRQLSQVTVPPAQPAPAAVAAPPAKELAKPAAVPAAIPTPAPTVAMSPDSNFAAPALAPVGAPQPAAVAAPPAALAPAAVVTDTVAATQPAKPAAASPADDDDDPKSAAAPADQTPDQKPVVPARLLFGAAKSSAPLAARSIGYYSRGCLAGAKALPVDGAGWQAMRLSRNRNWGHPELIALIERFAGEVQKQDGWPGLLVGDMSQPRGGPMLTGHSSHQIGLDADIWFTPMPSRKLTQREREDLSATSMIAGPLKVDPVAFTAGHVKLVKRAASYRQVERVLVHPAIKKALCEAAGTDRDWLSKVRPYFGHHYHFHIRIGCPKGAGDCKAQEQTKNDDGCGKELNNWFVRLTAPPKPHPPGYKPPPPKPPLTLADLPQECRVVLTSGNSEVVKDEAEMVRTSIERSKAFIDISGQKRSQ